MNLCSHIKICLGCEALVDTMRKVLRVCLFLFRKGINWALIPALSGTRYFSHLLIEGGKALDKGFATVSFSTNLL